MGLSIFYFWTSSQEMAFTVLLSIGFVNVRNNQKTWVIFDGTKNCYRLGSEKSTSYHCDSDSEMKTYSRLV